MCRIGGTILTNIRVQCAGCHYIVILLVFSVNQSATLANVVSSTGSRMSDQQPCLSEHVNFTT